MAAAVVPERGGRCLAAPASPDPVVKAEREAAWHGRQKAEGERPGRGRGGRQPAGRRRQRRPPARSRRPPPPQSPSAERGRAGARWRGRPRPRPPLAGCPAASGASRPGSPRSCGAGRAPSRPAAPRAYVCRAAPASVVCPRGSGRGPPRSGSSAHGGEGPSG